jgi:hypothetical protein
MFLLKNEAAAPRCSTAATRDARNHKPSGPAVLSPMSTIPVFLRSENPAVHKPQHSASLTLALLAISFSEVRWTDSERTAVQIVTSDTWKAVKMRVRKPRLAANVTAQPLPQFTNGAEFGFDRWPRMVPA